MKTAWISLSIIGLIIGTNAYAQDNLNPNTNYPVGGGYTYTPGLSGWSLKAGLNYQQFSNNGSTYAESDTHKLYNISPKYHTGYDLGIGYHLPNVDTELKLNYHHLHTSDSSDVWANNLTLFPGSLSLGPVTWASSNLSYDYDAFDFTAGHWATISNKFRINFYGGLNYTHLSKDMDTTGSGFGNTIHISGGTSFRGVGPTFGMDGYCSPVDTFPNFSIYGGVQPTILYGTMTGYVRTFVNDVRESDQIPDEKLVVPAMGAKIGLDWMYQYQGATIDARLGYEANQFWGITKDSNYTTSNNASYQGATFSLNFRF